MDAGARTPPHVGDRKILEIGVTVLLVEHHMRLVMRVSDVARGKDLFWATYMATSDDHEGFARAEAAYKEAIAT